VQSRQGAVRKCAHEREVQQIDVKMQHVEFVGMAAHFIQHHDVIRQRVLHVRIESQCARSAGHQCRRSPRIRTCKQRHLVALSHEFLGQVRDDAFGAAIELRGHALIERRNLCDPHAQNLHVSRRE
jgi:hypothetical protein